MSLSTLLIILAVTVVIPLAWYAWSLTRKVQAMEEQQEREEAEAAMQLRKYQEELISDIRFVSRSVLQQQCDITEGVLRLEYLLKGLDPDVWHMDELASLRAHHTATRSMPILDEYKALTPKQQFKIDKERLTLEHDNRLTIERDLKWLSTYSFPQVTLIQ